MSESFWEFLTLNWLHEDWVLNKLTFLYSKYNSVWVNVPNTTVENNIPCVHSHLCVFVLEGMKSGITIIILYLKKLSFSETAQENGLLICRSCSWYDQVRKHGSCFNTYSEVWIVGQSYLRDRSFRKPFKMNIRQTLYNVMLLSVQTSANKEPH